MSFIKEPAFGVQVLQRDKKKKKKRLDQNMEELLKWNY